MCKFKLLRAGLMYFLCNECTSTTKYYKLQKHLNTKHPQLWWNWPSSFVSRKSREGFLLGSGCNKCKWTLMGLHHIVLTMHLNQSLACSIYALTKTVRLWFYHRRVQCATVLPCKTLYSLLAFLCGQHKLIWASPLCGTKCKFDCCVPCNHISIKEPGSAEGDLSLSWSTGCWVITRQVLCLHSHFFLLAALRALTLFLFLY